MHVCVLLVAVGNVLHVLVFARVLGTFGWLVRRRGGGWLRSWLRCGAFGALKSFVFLECQGVAWVMHV